MSLHRRGGTHIVFGTDSFGVSFGVMLSCVQDISCQGIMSLHHRGGTHIAFGADCFGVSIGVMLSCVQDIS